MQYIYSVVDQLENFSLFSIVLRIILAMLCGGVLGIERGKAKHPAGMRTYILVCLGSALVMMTGQYMFEVFNSGDPARLGAQVVSGIGFLGAGSIIVESNTKIRGLTTAAGLWTSACIGLAIGVGFYSGAIVTTIVVYFVVSKFRIISNHFIHNDVRLRLYVEFDEIENLQELFRNLESSGMQIGEVLLNNVHEKKAHNAIISVTNIASIDETNLIQSLEKIEGIKTVSIIY